MWRGLIAFLLAWISTPIGATAVVRKRLLFDSFAQNDFSCRSTVHPNPVLILHGIGGNAHTGINALNTYLKFQGFCTFTITYGAYPLLPALGGIRPIAESSQEVVQAILQIQALTGAAKVSLVGHSEGGFQVLYVPKVYPEIAGIVDSVIALSPPTHGTTLSGLYLLAYVGGQVSRELVGEALRAVGLGAADDLGPDGPAVTTLTTAPIAQPGIQYTIIATEHDEIVTPPETAFVFEPGVRNLYIQEYCPNDPVGHIGMPFDRNVQVTVRDALLGSDEGPGVCTVGPQLDAILAALPGLGEKPIEQSLTDILGALQILR